MLGIVAIARVCHEANRAYCQSIGDMSQVPWEVAPEWQRTSAVNGVRFHLEHPGGGPEASHENWLVDKLAAGWVFGTVKNADKKEHPCCVPYDELPKSQRVKDKIFVSIVKAMKPLLTKGAD